MMPEAVILLLVIPCAMLVYAAVAAMVNGVTFWLWRRLGPASTPLGCGQILWVNLLSIAMSLPTAVFVFVLLMASRAMFGIRDLPGPPAPSIGGPPEWFVGLCGVIALAIALVVGAAVFVFVVRKKNRSGPR